tara:strand:+ start:1598 stop:2884 length:1287 start_codon:yes stop_codon:yes gene_type:complete
MQDKSILEYVIDELKKQGADKVACSLSNSEKKELNIEHGEMSLFRTTFNSSLSIEAFIEGKKGSTSINKIDKESIDRAVVQVIELSQSSNPDKCYDIAESQPPQIFSCGRSEADLDIMYDSLAEFNQFTKDIFPKIILEAAILDFTKTKTLVANSNGVSFEVNKGLYGFSPMFTAKDGTDTSSFNYTGFYSKNIDKPLHKYGMIEQLLRETEEQVKTSPIKGKFIGDIIVTPDCIGDFLSMVESHISDFMIISGRSVYKDKLNEPIASDKLTLHSHPLSEKLDYNYFTTGDGYACKNSTIIDRGILKTLLLGIYGANKTGRDRAVNNGGAHIVEPGDKALGDMISTIDKGILLSRFSGGSPSDNGDFSGVAKNSYYIENGKIKYPISETMISGNICKMLHDIQDISKETINDGSSIYPWIQFSGLTIS